MMWVNEVRAAEVLKLPFSLLAVKIPKENPSRKLRSIYKTACFLGKPL